MSGLQGGWGSTSQLYPSNKSRPSLRRWGRALSCKIKTRFSSKPGLFACILSPSFLQKLTVVGRSYSHTTWYPVCHDHTFTILRENHHLFHVRLGPLKFFRSRGTFASPLTGLKFKFRLEIPDLGFVNSNHLLQKFVPFFTKSVQQLLCNFRMSTHLFLIEVMRNPPGGNSTFGQAFSQNAVGRWSLNSSRMCNFFTCNSAVFLQDLEHRFHTLVISRRSGSS